MKQIKFDCIRNTIDENDFPRYEIIYESIHYSDSFVEETKSVLNTEQALIDEIIYYEIYNILTNNKRNNRALKEVSKEKFNYTLQHFKDIVIDNVTLQGFYYWFADNVQYDKYINEDGYVAKIKIKTIQSHITPTDSYTLIYKLMDDE